MPCPLPNQCGSCGWSHIPYAKQLAQKLSDINGSLKLKKLPQRVQEIVASPITEHYRNRMDFVINFQGAVGLREKGAWWKVIDNHPCFLADEKIETLFFTIHDWVKTSGLTFFDRKAHTGFLRYAVIRSTTLGQTMVNIVTSVPDSDDCQHILEQFAKSLNVGSVIWSINNTITDVSMGEDMRVLKGPGSIEEHINDFTYRISPNAFFQTNPHGAKILMDTVLEFVGDISGQSVVDLYCGSGFFTLPLSQKTDCIAGVELNTEAIADAKINAKINNINHITFIDSATEKTDWQQFVPQTLIVDPPRSGMHDKALQDILAFAPEAIIYVSCNPKNFARELVMLQEKYDVITMRAIDMFPHTPHVELVVKLQRK
jgi:23S rRNA (uracil1939-C5)-methyltransferase